MKRTVRGPCHLTEWASLVTLPMAHTSGVEGRLRAILQQNRRQGMLTPKTLIVAAGATLGVIGPLAALRPAAQAHPAAVPPKSVGRVDPRAQELLTQMGAAYKALQTFSCTETAEGGGAMGMPYHMDFAYGRPGRMAFSVTHNYGHKAVTKRLLLDGKTLYETAADTPGHYVRMAKAETNYTLWQQAFIIRTDVKNPITMELLEDGDTLTKRLTANDAHATITLGKPTVLDGVDVDRLVMRSDDGKGNRSYGEMLIGHQDHLLRRITDRSKMPNEPAMVMTQTFTHVLANPELPADTFVFTPPAGAVAVDQDPGGAHADPAALALMTQMYAAYDALKSYSCTLDSVVSGPSFGPTGKIITTDPVMHATYAIQKPRRVAMMRSENVEPGKDGVTRAVSDGNTLYVTTDEDNGPMKAKRARYLKLPVRADDWNSRLFLSRFGNIGSRWDNQDFMPNVVLGADTMPAASYDWKLGQPGMVNGEPVQTVTLRRDDGAGPITILLTLAISPTDHLLRQASTEDHEADGVHRQVETYTHIRINPALPPALFVFTPPPGSVPVSVAGDLYASR